MGGICANIGAVPIGFGEFGEPASGQVVRPCPEDMPTDQVKDGSDPPSYSRGHMMAHR